MSPLWRVLVASFIVLASFTVWFLLKPGSDGPQTVIIPPSSPVAMTREDANQAGAATITAPSPEPPEKVPSAPEIPVIAKPSHSSGVVSVPALEQQIRATRGVDERAELITELAHTDSAEAVLALERLFTIERHPKVQTALIASLNEMDSAILPDARLRILRAALSNQPRDVRTTALEVLAESKDPLALELLRKSSLSDPDHEVREVAAALYKANNQ